MSEVNIDYVVKYKDVEVAEKLYRFLTRCEEAPEDKDTLNGMLEALELDGASMLACLDETAMVSVMDISEDGEFEFDVFGGTGGGAALSKELIALLIQKQPEYLYSAELDDQIMELTFHAYVNGVLKVYWTGEGNEIDSVFYNALGERRIIDVFRECHAKGLLDMREVNLEE